MDLPQGFTHIPHTVSYLRNMLLAGIQKLLPDPLVALRWWWWYTSSRSLFVGLIAHLLRIFETIATLWITCRGFKSIAAHRQERIPCDLENHNTRLSKNSLQCSVIHRSQCNEPLSWFGRKQYVLYQYKPGGGGKHLSRNLISMAFLAVRDMVKDLRAINHKQAYWNLDWSEVIEKAARLIT